VAQHILVEVLILAGC